MRAFVQPRAVLSVLTRRASERARRKTRDLVKNCKRAIHEITRNDSKKDPFMLLSEISWIVLVKPGLW
jgi:hypothetical protein